MRNSILTLLYLLFPNSELLYDSVHVFRLPFVTSKLFCLPITSSPPPPLLSLSLIPVDLPTLPLCFGFKTVFTYTALRAINLL